MLFLHGWGLGHHAYRPALRQLTARGCQVVAPALPGFGGTAELPSGRRTPSGFAEWVASFIEAVGLTGPALVVGHSFGGGVAIRFAHDHPSLVRYLVLINSVGGPSWVGGRRTVRQLAERPPWDWAVNICREMLSPREGLDLWRAVSQDVATNVMRNPWALYEIGRLRTGAST